MRTVQLPVLSREYLKVSVQAWRDGAEVDPSGVTVEFSFPLPEADPAVWFPGEWEKSNRHWFARCLVGAGGTAALAAGTYDVWVRVTSAPERPARVVGVLVMT